MKKPEGWGRCFDDAALAVVQFPPGAILCHGIGIANAPGEEGNVIKHAWVEYEGDAFDTVWMARQDRTEYRAALKLSYVVEYDQAAVWENWRRYDMPGPWDEKIRAVGGESNE